MREDIFLYTIRTSAESQCVRTCYASRDNALGGGGGGGGTRDEDTLAVYYYKNPTPNMSLFIINVYINVGLSCILFSS